MHDGFVMASAPLAEAIASVSINESMEDEGDAWVLHTRGTAEACTHTATHTSWQHMHE